MEEKNEEEPLRPPETGSRFGNLKMGGVGKTVAISVIVSVVVMGLMSVGGKGGFFVNKADFTSNMQAVVTALDAVTGMATKSQTDVSTAIQNIPSAVTTQVDTKLSQSMASVNSQLTAINEKLTAANNQANTANTKLAELTTKVNSDIAGLSAKITSDSATLNAKDKELADKIASLQSNNTSALERTVLLLLERVTRLETQGVLSTVTVDETVKQLGIQSGVAIVTSLVVVNNSNTDVTLPVQLDVVAPAGVTAITSATMTGTYTSTISGSVVTYHTTAFVPANSTITFGGVKITVIYAGTPTGTWSVQWKKRI